MRPKTPQGASLFHLLLLLLPVASLQHAQQFAVSPPAADVLSVGAPKHDLDSLNPPLSGRRGFRDTNVDTTRPHSSHNDERALATFSPADSNPALRDPPASGSSASAGLSARLPARSLQDWQVEDIVLLATVDGKIYARDRITGNHRWLLEVDRPMVETIYHTHKKVVDEDGVEQEDRLWIVEPSQDGSIYVYAPGSGLGLQRLPYTVKQLAELAPYASDGKPAVAYTAEKRTTLYTIDAATGHILRKFSSAGSIRNDESRCRRVSPLDAMEEEACEAIGTITLGHTEYTIGIQDRDSGEQLSTLKYFEWGPNNRDSDLRSKYMKTMDGKYIAVKHDGYIYGLDFSGRENSLRALEKPTYLAKLSAPVARVYDLVRPVHDNSGDASLVVLPQPVAPVVSEFSASENKGYENIFVNCTESGSWYALSESTYPTVTEGAKLAKCYRDGFFSVPSLPLPKSHRDMFRGLHWLSPQNQAPEKSHIGAPVLPGLDAPPVDENDDTPKLIDPPRHGWGMPSLRTVLLALVIGLAGCGVAFKYKDDISPKQKLLSSRPVALKMDQANAEVEPDDPKMPTTPMIREAEPAEEIIFPVKQPHERKPSDIDEDKSMSLTRTDSNESPENVEESPAKDPAKPKVHKRGKRGGRKAREKEQAIAAAKGGKPVPVIPETPAEAEIISVADSESPQISGPLQINSLIIHTDRVIGQGSCGTSVFEGSFEGRDVAVKRMLSQYYELASQEVSFLQQSDDHPNVVRYFCQQKDDHFLYIAVELCQASLFEVWEPEKARTEERQQQLQTLKHSIQQDIPKALQQLAGGLYHLHNLRIIHRDIKPQNILVAYPKRNQPNGSRLVISDFGLGKNLPENVSTLVDPTGNAGTSGWKAPELISQPRDTDSRHSQHNSHTGHSEGANGIVSGVKRAADIFSLGCLFFWVLTDGIHPYEDENGWQQLRELNIKRDNKKMEVLERWSDAYEPMQLITSMLEHQPQDRPTALQVLNHPFFWPAEKRLAFLCDVSDHFEREPRGVVDDGYAGDSDQLAMLEDRAPEVIGASHRYADFLACLDKQFVDTLGKQRKYSGNRLLDLLRALRNKKNHYEDMPEDVKKRVGPLAGGYLSYWCNRFPRLLMACYEVVHDCNLQDSSRFKGYFEHDV